jgi:3-isopropylmalate/(R)-2-methylmalate dehydratase small subunit
MEDAKRGANATMTIDLETHELVRSDGQRIAFDIEPFRRQRLLKGLDEIGATLAQGDKIDGFEAELAHRQPWRARVLEQRTD